MNYRAEIDGLRALAVIPVILFHAGFNIFSGGYVGVDIFFVISGYLITTILIEDLENKKFNIFYFYERRARRILPALSVVLLITIILAWIFLNDAALNKFAGSIIGVSLFFSNIVFWKQQGYFEESAELNPLLHTWSLAIEEQYYLVFPIFLYIAWRFGKSRIFWLLVLIALISLALSEWGWRNKERANFYLTPTRAWEIFAGSIAAFIVDKRGVRKNNFLAILGLVAIIFSIFGYDENTPFPSIYTLIPVLGVVLLILYAEKDTIVAKLLSIRVFVGVGLISYSAYLWHQPIFAYTRIYNQEISISNEIRFVLIFVTLLIGFLSWRYIERPFRAKSNFSKSLIITMSVVSVTIFLFMAYATKKVVRGNEYALAKSLSKNKYVYFQNMDERKFIEGRLIHPLRQVNHVVVGSSRMMQISSETIGEPMINFSVSAAIVEDLIAIAPEAIAKLNSKNIYLAADPWMISLNDGQNNRYKSISSLYDYWFDRASNKKELKNFLSLKNIKYSEENSKSFLVSLRSKLQLKKYSIPIDDRFEAYDKKSYDGVHIYNQIFNKNKPHNYDISWFNNSFENFEHDIKAEENFQILINYIKNLNAKVFLILSPYHPKVYSIMKSQKPIFLDIEKKFRDFAYKNNIEIIGSYDPSIYACQSEEFYDGEHPKPSCMKKIFNNLQYRK